MNINIQKLIEYSSKVLKDIRSFIDQKHKNFCVLNFNNLVHGYVILLSTVAIPLILYGAKWFLDTRTQYNVAIVGVKDATKIEKIYKKCAKEAALAVAKNWNPGLTLGQQMEGVYKVADMIYNEAPSYHLASAVHNAISGIDIPSRLEVDNKGEFFPLIVRYKDYINLSPSAKFIKYSAVKNYVHNWYANSSGSNGNYLMWLGTDKASDAINRQSQFDELIETDSADGSFALEQHEIFLDSHTYSCNVENHSDTSYGVSRVEYGSVSNSSGSLGYYGMSSNLRPYGTVTDTQYSSKTTESTNYNTTYYSKRSTGDDANYVNISIADDLLDGGKICVSTDLDLEDDRDTKSTVAYAVPAQCNVDIVLAVPVNSASSNINNYDAVSYPSGTISTYNQSTSLPNAVKQTPIYKMGQACKNFVKDHFFHTRGVYMSLIPYSGKLSISPDRASDWTVPYSQFIDTTTEGRLMVGACLYGTKGQKNQLLTQPILTTTVKSGTLVATPYYWGGLRQGCPIMFRRGIPYGYYYNNPYYGGYLLNNADPNSGDNYRYLRMNLNPCHIGSANQLSMKCDSNCTYYAANPYYIIEPTADLVKIYEMCNALKPFYDEHNVSNFLFLPFEWANNLYQIWTRDPGTKVVTGDEENAVLNNDSKSKKGRKKALVLLVNKPDWFEPGEMTYLGFDNDFSEIPTAESDKIDFSINYSSSNQYLDESTYSSSSYRYGPKKILRYETYSGTMSYDSSSKTFQTSSSKVIGRLYFPHKGTVRVTVEPKYGNSDDWSNWEYYPQALNREGSKITNWGYRTSNSSRYGSFAMNYGNGTFVLLSSAGQSAYSYDGRTWYRGNNIGRGGGYSWGGMAWNGSSFVALTGYGGYTASSLNGKSWTMPVSSVRNVYSGYLDDDLGWNGEYLFAMGDNLRVYKTSNATGSSGWFYDGTSSDRLGDGEQWKYGGGYYVRFYPRTNSSVRSSRTMYGGYVTYSLPKAPYMIHYSNEGYWVILTEYGDVMRSTDSSASRWTLVNGSTSNNTSSALYRLSGKSDWNGISYGSGKWVAYTRSGDVAVIELTSGQIVFKNIGDSQSHKLVNKKTFTITPDRISSKSNGEYYVEFEMSGMKLVSAEITNAIIGSTLMAPVSYNDADYSSIAFTELDDNQNTTLVSETIDFTNGYDSCHVGKFVVDYSKNVGDACMNRSSGKQGYDLSSQEGTHIPCRIEADYPCDVQLEVEQIPGIAKGKVTFYKDNISSGSSDYDVRKNSTSGESINLGEEQTLTSGQTYVFSGGIMPGGTGSVQYGSYTSTKGRNFSHNLSVKKVRYYLSNATITNCVLKNQILRDYGVTYFGHSYKTPLYLNNGTSATADVFSTYSVHTGTVSVGSDVYTKVSRYMDSCIQTNSSYTLCHSNTYAQTPSSVEYIVYGIEPSFDWAEAGYRADMLYYTSNGYIDIGHSTPYGKGTYWFQYNCTRSSGLGSTGIKIKLVNNHDAVYHSQFFIQNRNDKVLQFTTPIGTDPINYTNLIQNRGIYLINYDSQNWICFQGDGELHVTVMPLNVSTTANLKVYSKTDNRVIANDGTVVGNNDSSSRALNIGTSGVTEVLSQNVYGTQTINISKDKFIKNGDSIAHDYHLLFSCQNLKIKKAKLTYNYSTSEALNSATVCYGKIKYRLKSAKPGTALIRVTPVQNIPQTTASGYAFRDGWVNRGTPLSSISGSYWGCDNAIVYANGKFIVSNKNGYIAQSKDGITWSQAAYTGSSNGTRGVTYGNGYYFFVKDRTAHQIYRSTGGSSWVSASTSHSSGYSNYGLSFGNGMLLSGKDGYGPSMSHVSYTGTNDWFVPSGRNFSSYCRDYHGNRFTFGNGRFVIVNYSSGNVTYSDNGVTWKSAGVTLKSLNNCCYYDALGYGNGTFAFLHNSGAIAVSKDGISWSWVGGSSSTRPVYSVTSKSSSWAGIAYGNGRWVAVNNDGSVATCDDPIADFDSTKWYQVASGAKNYISGVTTISIDMNRTDSSGMYYSDVTFNNLEILGNVMISGASNSVDDIIHFYGNNTTSSNTNHRSITYSGAGGSHIGGSLYSRTGTGRITMSKKGKLTLKIIPSLSTQRGKFTFRTGSDTVTKPIDKTMIFTIDVEEQKVSGNNWYVEFDMENIVLVYAEFLWEPDYMSVVLPSTSNSSYVDFTRTYSSKPYHSDSSKLTFGTDVNNTNLPSNFSFDSQNERWLTTGSVNKFFDKNLKNKNLMWLITEDINSATTLKKRYYSSNTSNRSALKMSTYMPGLVRRVYQADQVWDYLGFENTNSSKVALVAAGISQPVNAALYAQYKNSISSSNEGIKRLTQDACTKLKQDNAGLRIYIVKYNSQQSRSERTRSGSSLTNTTVQHDYDYLKNCTSYIYSANDTTLKSTLDAVANDIKTWAEYEPATNVNSNALMDALETIWNDAARMLH